MEIIIRGGIREGKTTVATLIYRLLSVLFTVKLEDDDYPPCTDLLELKTEALRNNGLEITIKTEQVRREE